MYITLYETINVIVEHDVYHREKSMWMCSVLLSRRMPSVELQLITTLRDLFRVLLPERSLRAPSDAERQQRHRADTERQWSAEQQLLSAYTRFIEQLESRASRRSAAPRVRNFQHVNAFVLRSDLLVV